MLVLVVDWGLLDTHELFDILLVDVFPSLCFLLTNTTGNHVPDPPPHRR